MRKCEGFPPPLSVSADVYLRNKSHTKIKKKNRELSNGDIHSEIAT